MVEAMQSFLHTDTDISQQIGNNSAHSQLTFNLRYLYHYQFLMLNIRCICFVFWSIQGLLHVPDVSKYRFR